MKTVGITMNYKKPWHGSAWTRYPKCYDELSGKDKNRKRTNNVWYKHWRHLAKIVKVGGGKKDIMMAVYQLVNSVEGYGSKRIAFSSRQDLELVFEDCLNRDCDNCSERFRCFTE